MTDGYPKVAIIIVNWNGKEDTAECIESLGAITYPAYEVIVVDNASSDGSPAYLRERFPGLYLIENRENLGFSAGNNVGIGRAMENGADYVLLLNNDTVVKPDFLDELVRAAEADGRIGIAGPKMYYYEPKNMIYFAGATINWYTGRTKHVGIKTIDNGRYDRPADADFIAGAGMLIRKKAIDSIGMLPTEYFLQYEDIDYSVNAHRHGYRLAYVPGSVIWHKISASTQKIKADKLYYETRNRFIFLKKYSTKAQYLCSSLYFLLYYWPLGAVYLAASTRDKKILFKYGQGLLDGLRRPKNRSP